MYIKVNDQKHTVEIWLDSREKKDFTLRESLQPVFQRYKEEKYLVAVFQSGEQDLYKQTYNLLLYNRRRQAEQEVQAAKQKNSLGS